MLLPRGSAPPARVATALVIAGIVLSACSSSNDSPPPSSQSPPTVPNEPITATVSNCTGPSGSGKTSFYVTFHMDGVDDPIHLQHVVGFATFQGTTPVKATPGPPTQEQPGPGDPISFSGPEFDRLVLNRPTMRVDAQQTIHADSVQQLEDMRFSGPFGPARLTEVRVRGQRVTVKVSSAKLAAPGVQSLGPQEGSLQVGSATLGLQGGATSGPEGSRNVSQMTFTGPLPSTGPATLMTSTWQILDLKTITILLPADCEPPT